MLKELILINSANCDFAQIKVDKDLFFGGSNGTGKTTTIRALQYLFVSDSNLLGLDSNKKSFKEYYLGDTDSFIIYVFEEFFILLYRVQSGIGRYFSKQSFDISRIENSDINEIKKYVKEAKSYRPQNIEDFRKVLYGQDLNHLDFSIANIKDFKSFIKLFAGVFDIQKAITSTDDIKVAIYKSMSNLDTNIDFNSSKFLNNIFEFQNSLRFFKSFKSQEKNIEKSIELKDNLIELEQNIKTLNAQIAFRIEFEQKEIAKLELEQRDLNSKNEKLNQKKKFLSSVKEKFHKKLNGYIVKTLAKLNEIDRLNRKFSKEQIEESRSKSNLLSKYQKEKSQKLQSKYIIEQENRELLREIEIEIENLNNSFKEIEIELKKESIESKQYIKEAKELEIEKLNTQFDEFKEKIEAKREEIDKDRDNLNDEINLLKDSIRGVEAKLDEEFKKESHFFELEINGAKKNIDRYKSSIFDKTQELKRVEQKIEDIERAHKREINNSLYEYEDINRKLKKELSKIDSLLDLKKGSFREFLDKNVKNWERELFPILDEKLLSMSVNKLEPKLKRDSDIFGIELNFDLLKKIQTKDELLYEQNSIIEKIDKLKRDFEAREKVLIDEKNISIDNNKKEIEKIKIEIETYQNRINNSESGIKEIKKELEVKKAEFEKLKIDRVIEQKAKLKELASERENLLNNRNSLKKEIEIEKNRVNQAKNKIELNSKANQSKIDKELKEKVTKAREKIDKEIKEKREKAKNISASEKLKELEEEIRELEKEIETSNRAKIFLEEYEEIKKLLNEENSLKSRESKLNLKFENSQKNLESKKRNIELKQKSILNELANLESDLVRFKVGLKEAKEIEIENIEPLESSEALINLINEFREKTTIYEKDFIKFERVFTKLKTLIEFKEISYKYSQSEVLRPLADDRDTIEYILELDKLKRAITSLKEEEELKFKAIIEAIKQKLENLSHKEDDLIKEIKKTNKRLKGIKIDVLEEIEIKYSLLESKSFTKISNKIIKEIDELTITQKSDSLFFDRQTSDKTLKQLEELLSSLRDNLAEDENLKFSGVDLKLRFIENNQRRNNIKYFKNIGSNGTSILLKIIIITALLSIYKDSEKSEPFYLIIDEIGAIEKNNQDAIREFANSYGFKTVFSTTNPILSKPKDIRYYRFARESDKFEVISLNRID